MEEKISVIVPVFKAESTIERCIKSVQCQTVSVWELILVNDGSPDKSSEICSKYAANDKRINLINQSNRGVSAARNTGIDAASGDYVFFLDSDDAIVPDALEKYLNVIDESGADIIAGTLCIINEDGEKTVKGPKGSGVHGNEIWNHIADDSEPFGWAGGKCIRRKLLNDNNIRFDCRMSSQEDLEFNLSVYLRAEKVYLCDYPAYLYYHVRSERKSQINDYISNQLKLYNYGKKRTALSEAAEKSISNRIAGLVYTYMYNADTPEKAVECGKSMSECAGLLEYLNTHVPGGEKGFVIRLIISGRYNMIYWYFKIRNSIRDSLRKIRK